MESQRWKNNEERTPRNGSGSGESTNLLIVVRAVVSGRLLHIVVLQVDQAREHPSFRQVHLAVVASISLQLA